MTEYRWHSIGTQPADEPVLVVTHQSSQYVVLSWSTEGETPRWVDRYGEPWPADDAPVRWFPLPVVRPDVVWVPTLEGM